MKTPQIVSFGLVAGFVLASNVQAQTPPPAVPVEQAAPAKAEPAKAAPVAPPVLSEAEKAAIDVLSLIAQRDQALKDLGQCSAQLVPLQAQQREGQLRARIDSLRQVIERTHPGYRWDVEKGTLVPSAVKASPPKAAPK